MRKLAFTILAVLALALAIAVTACGKEDDSSTQLSLNDISTAIKSAVEYPETMEEVTDTQRLKDDWGLEEEYYEEVYAIQSPITVHLYEMVVVKAKDGHSEDLQDALKGRIERLKKEYAFYPNQVDIANAAVVGSKGDYVYLIAHENAADAKKAIDNL